MKWKMHSWSEQSLLLNVQFCLLFSLGSYFSLQLCILLPWVVLCFWASSSFGLPAATLKAQAIWLGRRAPHCQPSLHSLAAQRVQILRIQPGTKGTCHVECGGSGSVFVQTGGTRMGVLRKETVSWSWVTLSYALKLVLCTDTDLAQHKPWPLDSRGWVLNVPVALTGHH